MREELSAALRTWAALLALSYPFSLLAQLVVHAAPALVRAALPGQRLEMLQVNWTTVRAASATVDGEVKQIQTTSWAGAVTAAAAVGLAGRCCPAPSGLLLALLGQAALGPWIGRIFFRQDLRPETLLIAALFFAIMVWGVCRMAAGERVWLRLATVAAGFLLPSVILWRAGGLPGRNYWLLAPGLAAAGAAVSRSRPFSAPGWRWAAGGLAASLSLFGAIRWTGPAIQDAFRRSHREALASAPSIPDGLPYPRIFFQKGVNFTAEWPDVYASAGARQALEMLPRYGINAVALVAYGFSPRGQPRISIPGARGSWESDDGLEFVSKAAHQLGMRVLLKPQLWVGGRSYPGEIEFPAPADRDAWFAQYRRFVEHYARLAVRIHADVLCLGVELSKMTPYEAQWRALIARAREIYPGPLVYGASWGPEFENIAFWDALDYIGLNNYYPLPDDLSTAGVAAKVEAVQRRFGKPVIFTEAGFSAYEAPQREPWDEKPRRVAPDDQARCYEAIFRAFYERPWFQGVYWWKVGTNRAGGPEDGSHTPWGKPAMQVVARWYLGGRR